MAKISTGQRIEENQGGIIRISKLKTKGFNLNPQTEFNNLDNDTHGVDISVTFWAQKQ